MAGTNDKILDTISNMTVMEVVDLISEMEEKFGVKAAAVAAAPAAAGGGEAAAEEKSTFDVSLESFGGNKVAVIKAARTVTGATKICNKAKLSYALKWGTLSNIRRKKSILYKLKQNITASYLTSLIPIPQQNR